MQATYRGHLARLEANAERELQMAEIEFEAALRVQAVMRGHWGRYPHVCSRMLAYADVC